MTAERTRAPGFILCPARSGSTLLRLILNGHPEIACPPETNLVDVFTAIGFSVAATDGSEQIRNDSTEPAALVAQRAAALCRDVADEILGTYARAQGKAMWIDKSLPSVLYGDLLMKLYPDARFICLYRQCADTVASLHEASSWSYGSFGVLPFAQTSPGNLAQALTAYWVDRVSQLQAFEQAHPSAALRIRYEDLVARPEETVRLILEFLEVASDDAAAHAALAFTPRAAAQMPGDVKLRFSKGIDSSSVGRGWSVPFEMIAPDLRERVDAISAELGYTPLPNLRQYITGPATSLLSSAPPQGPHVQDATRILKERDFAPTDPPAAGRKASSLLKLVLTDFPEPWMIDLSRGHVARRDGEANWLALTDSATLTSLVMGHSNPGTEMRNSTIQVVSASDETRPDEFLDCVDELMTLLRG